MYAIHYNGTIKVQENILLNQTNLLNCRGILKQNIINTDVCFSPRHRKHNESSAQKFSFDDGYITCLTNSRLVLGVHEIEGLSSELVLLKRKPDDVTQKWILQDNGFVAIN